jgi:hypothetical protein
MKKHPAEVIAEVEDVKTKINKFAISLVGKEPLDGDEVEYFANYFKIQLDYANGNITEKERNYKLILLDNNNET